MRAIHNFVDLGPLFHLFGKMVTYFKEANLLDHSIIATLVKLAFFSIKSVCHFSHCTPGSDHIYFRMGLEPAFVRPCARPSTLSDMNISETSWPIIIKFHLKHNWGWIGCIRFWARSDQNSGFHGNR